MAASIKPGPTHTSGATTIDALFGPLPVVESRGRAWLYMDKKLKPISLRLGVSDGTFTEILSGEIQQGQEVVTAMVTGLEPKTTPPGGNNANNPLMGPQRGGPGGDRGPGGGGRGQYVAAAGAIGCQLSAVSADRPRHRAVGDRWELIADS